MNAIILKYACTSKVFCEEVEEVKAIHVNLLSNKLTGLDHRSYWRKEVAMTKKEARATLRNMLKRKRAALTRQLTRLKITEAGVLKEIDGFTEIPE